MYGNTRIDHPDDTIEMRFEARSERPARPSKWTRIIAPLIALGLALALAPGCIVYEVYRGARVPRPVPAPVSAQAMTGTVEAGLSAGGFAEASAPAPGESDAGLFLPRMQGRANLRFEPIEGLSLGLLHERGFAAGSRALVKGTPEPDGDAAGYGASLGYATDVGPGPWSVAMGVDAMLYQIPYIEYRIAFDGNGEQLFIEEEQGMSQHPVIAFHLLSSYAMSERLAFTGGVTVRNHPTIERTGIELGLDQGWDNVESGPFNVTLAAGVEYTHHSGVRASLLAYQTVIDNPVQYYPALAASISVPLVRKASKTAHSK